MLENSSKLTSNMCSNILVLKIFSYKDFLLLLSLEEKYRILANPVPCPSSISIYTIFF